MNEAADAIFDSLSGIAAGFPGWGERLSPVYLAAATVIAFVVHSRSGNRDSGGFFRWLLPRDVYFHRSHLVDIKLFLIGRLFGGLGLVNRLALGTAISAATVGALAGLFGAAEQPASLGLGQAALLTLVFAAVADFSTYWVHRLHHDNPVLWPFHAVHHSAEVLTPVTLYRKHPVYDVLGSLLRALFLGISTGIVVFALFGRVGMLTLGGANVVYCAFNFVGANLRHSHIWLSYGPVLERVFISPAQHQIHHSRSPAHRDRNYGEVFALWDWMFGTLYVPGGQESFEIGLVDMAGETPAQPHLTLREALWRPFGESLAALRQATDSKAFRRRTAMEQVRKTAS